MKRNLSLVGLFSLSACASPAKDAQHPPAHEEHASGEHASGDQASGDHAGQHPGEHDQHVHHGAMQHDFSDAASWAKRFDNAERDAWQRPSEVAQLLQIKPGMTVVDLGAGTGYFGSYLSRAVGGEGRVIALDVEKNMVSFMQERFKREGFSNIEAKVCPLDATGLDAAVADRVLIVDTWHHIENREAYVKHLATVLKPGGWVAVVDFTLETDKGPPAKHRIRPQDVSAELKAGGLVPEMLREDLPDQYVVVGRKAP